jgi:hypothetical protein
LWREERRIYLIFKRERGHKENGVTGAGDVKGLYDRDAKAQSYFIERGDREERDIPH